MIRRTVSILLLSFAFVSCATAPGAEEDQSQRSRYDRDSGQSPVGVIPEAVVLDAERGTDVVFSVEYPTRPGSHPLIIFSHGFGARRDVYVGLSAYWASQGYVVIRPAHSDSGRVQRGNVEQAWRDQTPADWRARVRDVTAILDGLDRIEESYPELRGKVDRERIGVGGHSYGAFTAMLIGGTRTFPGGTSYADPRVKAIVPMSPQGPSDIFGLTAESWKDVTLPVLYMTGTEDRGIADDETPEWRRQAFELSPGGDKWLIVFQGARHASFTGRMEPMSAQPPPRIPDVPVAGTTQPAPQPTTPREGPAGLRVRSSFANVKALSLAFWDAYLRDDAEGRSALENAAGRGAVELRKK